MIINVIWSTNNRNLCQLMLLPVHPRMFLFVHWSVCYFWNRIFPRVQLTHSFWNRIILLDLAMVYMYIYICIYIYGIYIIIYIIYIYILYTYTTIFFHLVSSCCLQWLEISWDAWDRTAQAQRALRWMLAVQRWGHPRKIRNALRKALSLVQLYAIVQNCTCLVKLVKLFFQ